MSNPFTEARYGLQFGFVPGDDGWGASFNRTIRTLGAMLNAFLISDTATDPPGSPADGDSYFLPSQATGAWQGHDGSIASYQGASWMFLTPPKGLRAYILSRNDFLWFDGSQWGLEHSGLGGGGGGGVVAGSTIRPAVVKSPDATGTADGTFGIELDLYAGDGNPAVVNGHSNGGNVLVKAGTGFSSGDNTNQTHGNTYLMGGDRLAFSVVDFAANGHNGKAMPGVIVLYGTGRQLTEGGGAVFIQGGDSQTAYSGGDATFKSGAGNNGCGNVTITTGRGKGNGSRLTITTGDGEQYNPTSDLYLTTGSTFNGDPGNIVIQPGQRSDNNKRALIKMPGLPTLDPHVSDALWNNGGVLSVSAG